ncbi:MAG TPA: lamin tail domain-containing protein, partial [Verrucomicrobiae bacterium]|nr:lamin tail domain-containing protein [Verrucomicrobiae bacterium]
MALLIVSLAQVAHASLPIGWTDADIGSPGIAGSASMANGVWTVAGGGSDIWNDDDQFNFVSTPFLCDGAVIAQVRTVQNTDPWAKAGVMFRNDTTAGAINVNLVVSEANGVNFEWRSATGGACTAANSGGAAPLWVKLTRSDGDNFSGYYSSDGTNWLQVGSTETIPLNGPLLAGLCVTAHNNSDLNTSTFSNVSLTSAALGVYRQLWTNLSSSVGDTLAALTNTTDNPNWPNSPVPSFTHVFTNFETEINTGMNYYGQRVRALVVPPLTGNYTFWIASDDTSKLFLSTNETAAGSRPIASNTGYTSAGQWNKYTNQQSAPVLLQAGYRYYLEADMQQGTGGDNLAVGWQLPNGALEQPMSALSAAGTLMIPFNGTNTHPGILSQSTNTTVVENQPVTFNVVATNQAPMTYKWYVNGTPTTVTNPSLVLASASVSANNGQTYTCVLTNATGAVTTAPIVLTVTADTVPPVVSQIFNVQSNFVDVVFSKPVTLATATEVTNYAFSDGLFIANATLASDNVTVSLNVAPLAYGSNYSLVINGILDTVHTPVMIASNTVANFTAYAFVPDNIGSPPVTSTTTVTSNGLIVTTDGSIGSLLDQCNFQYQQVTGNFDVSVCLSGLGLSDLWAAAGLMARQTLAPGSTFAASLATPSMVGAFFESRNASNTTATSTGSFPVNYPSTWLRLNRVGNIFTGFASYDGTNWTQMGSATLTMPAAIYLGMTVASDSTNQLTTASFVNYSNTPAGALIVTAPNPHEPLGPSSRLTPIAFSEIMYKPAPRTDSNNCEYIEVYNSEPWFHDISGYQITCADMNYTFPPNTTIPGGGFLVVAASPDSIRNVYGITNVMGPYTGSLKHAETLELLDEVSNVLLTVPYTDVYPWPVAADGSGHSIVLDYPSYGESNPQAWDISDIVGGSPGAMESYRPSPLRNVVINEILPHSENPGVEQFIELYNHSTSSVNISGCILTDDPATNEFVIPSGTVIGPRGFISFSQSQFGFTLNGAGETLYFIKPDNSRVLDAVQFGAQADGVSYGRWPDGANDFYAFTTNTPGTNNSPILIGDIVINELMYDPISGNDDDQYIELYNKGTNTIDLAGWQLTSGVTFTFPSDAFIGPGGYVVIGKNTANLFANYPNLNSANTYGNYSGKLSHNGELIVLAQPESFFGTNTILVEEDEVTYGTGGRWGQWSGGNGSSLELIDPHSNHRLAANWADSDETHKSSWVDIETTGVLDNGANYETGIQHAQIGLLDTGEAMVDNVEVDFNGTNFIVNSNFESGIANWSLQGDHSRSSLDSPGYDSSYALHLRASDHMWNAVNSCEANLAANNMAAGDVVTLRFKARWLRGWPEAMLRLNGNWLQAYGALPVPSNLGTPGAPNSALVANAGPAIYKVSHSPSIPVAGQPVVVSAHVHDPDGVQSLTLYYRVDPSTSYTAAPMNDAGLSGDAIAGDGIFSATIPAQSSGTIVAFYIGAVDARGNTTRFPALLNNNAPVPECVIGFGDATASGGNAFGAYHCWITQTNSSRWANLSDLSNEGSDFTFAYNNRIIYNAQGHFSGSPYHQDFDTPTGNLCHYKWEFPEDDQLLGTDDFNKIHQPGNGPGDDASLQREQIANTFLRALGVPWLNRRYVSVYFNGNLRGSLMEDAQVPGSAMVKEHYPNDSDGFLFKMQPWFEFAPFPSGSTIGFTEESWCVLEPFTTTGGVLKLARYRYPFEMRRSPGSESDYSDPFALIEAANSSLPNFPANMMAIANMENWMRVFAANHAAGNWDSFGAENAQNLYGYIGAQGTKYALMMWDFNIVFGNSSSWTPGQNLFFTTGGDTNMAAIYQVPVFQRMYWRALQELVNGPLANSAPLANAKYAAFVNSGLIGIENPTQAILPWLSQAQSSIASQLAAVNASAFSLSPTVVVSNDVAYISGGAPVNVDTITINGANYPLTWITLTNWTVAVPDRNGTIVLNVLGLDKSGNPVPGASGSVQAIFSPTVPSPVGHVVVNEIMYAPVVPNAQFIEFYNNSTNEYDLSGWDVSPISYVFPAGSTLAPNSFLVLAANSTAYATAYGATNAPFDIFSNALPTNGETMISLLEPQNGTNLMVTQVQYSNQLPWPANVTNTGASLQLIDPHQDNWRAGNWSSALSNATPTYKNAVAATLPAFPTLWLNEVEPDNLTGLTNSAGAHVPWIEIFNPGSNAVSLAGLYLSTNYSALTSWSFPAGATINAGAFFVVFADGQTGLSTASQPHTGFTLPPVSGSIALSRLYNAVPQVLDYLDYTQMLPNYSYGSYPDGQSFVRQVFVNPTPRASNDGSALPPPSFIPYTVAGSTYSQNFDALPDPGSTSIDSANPVTINGITYSLANPFDFAYPAETTGNSGGLGIQALNGWFGLANPIASVGTRFGATDGDQTTGGDISFGLPNSSDRALGLLATSTTGYTAFGARFINVTGLTLNSINLQFTAEVWRQSNLPKTLEFYYFIDPTATNAFSTAATAFLPVLNVSFPTVPGDVGGAAVDGTAGINQTNLSVMNQTITNWPPGAALWLVWEMASSTGKSQGLGIDNLAFSAIALNPVAVTVQASGTNFVLSWPA